MHAPAPLAALSVAPTGLAGALPYTLQSLREAERSGCWADWRRPPQHGSLELLLLGDLHARWRAGDTLKFYYIVDAAAAAAALGKKGFSEAAQKHKGQAASAEGKHRRLTYGRWRCVSAAYAAARDGRPTRAANPT